MQHSINLLPLLVLAAAPTDAGAQESDQWTGDVEIAINPSFEQSSVFDLTEDFDQKAETEATFTLKSPAFWHDHRANFSIGTKYSPSRFFDQDQESAVIYQIGVGSAPFNISRIASQNTWTDSKIEDTVKYNLFYRHTENYTDLFGQGSSNEERVGLKVAFVDVRSIACSTKNKDKLSATEKTNFCGQGDEPELGISFAIGGALQRSWSTDPAQDQDAISVSGRLIGPEIYQAFRLFGEAEVGYGRFRNVTNLAGKNRKDADYTLRGGLDLGPVVGDQFGLDVGLAQTWTDSNVVGETEQEFTATASISWQHNLFGG